MLKILSAHYLHPADVDGEHGEEEEHLEQEVGDERDDGDETELLDGGREGEEATQQDQHPRHERLEDVPALLADTCNSKQCFNFFRPNAK